jgi:hypothetical protein
MIVVIMITANIDIQYCWSWRLIDKYHHYLPSIDYTLMI